MTEIIFDKHRLHSEEGESVLDTLLRHEQDVAYSCKSGACQTCMLRCVDGNIPAESQKELKQNLREQGFFLACQCIPATDMTVERPDATQLFVAAELIDKQQLSPTVYRLRLSPSSSLSYRAGQFVNVRRSDGLTRSYSLASLPTEDDYIELHIKRMENGAMSNWLADEFSVGDCIDIGGALGSCFYSKVMNDQPVLLVGSGTGLAPLFGVIRDAFHQGHTGPVHLYHGARTNEELYLDKQLREMAELYSNFSYTTCITGEMPRETVQSGKGCDVALSDNPTLSGWQVFLCGSPVMVRSLQQRAFLAGADLRDIHTDPFETKS